MNYESVLGVLLTWAGGDDNVRCIVLTGSAASATSHPLSDRDLELHVRDRDGFEQDDSWWRGLGEVLAVERLEDGNDRPTRLVYYVGGKVDFTLVDIGEERGVYDRPFEVLLDKDGDAAGFRLEERGEDLPDQASFDRSMNWGSAAAMMIAKAIVRDEPWSVKVRDSDLKTELLRVIEWDHRVRHGGQYDVRYSGTKMRGWMDADVQERLEACWASFDLADSRSALLASMDLFRDLSSRIAATTNLRGFDHDAVRSEMTRILHGAAGV